MILNKLSDSYIKVCHTILDGIKSYYSESLKRDLSKEDFVDIFSKEVIDNQSISSISDVYKLSCRNIIDSIRNHVSEKSDFEISEMQMPDIIKEIYCS